MRIENNSSIYFKARLINNEVNIAKKFIYPDYFGETVSFVEIDPTNSLDLIALKNAVFSWFPYDKFGKYIFNIADKINLIGIKYDWIYALTTQEKEFDKLDYSKILGLVDIKPKADKSAYIEYIQVNPKMLIPTEPEYKGIGTAMINCLKNFCSRISCFPINEAFFIKNGFVKNGWYRYEWQNPNIH